MRPKKTLMRLLLIGVVGSVLVGASCCMQTTGGETTTSYYDYHNNTNYQIELKVYSKEKEYAMKLEKGEVLSQTVKSGAISYVPEGSILFSDSICIIFPELNKELWYKGPLSRTTDKVDTTPFLFENYTREKVAENKFRSLYNFTQVHIDLAEPIDPQFRVCLKIFFISISSSAI